MKQTFKQFMEAAITPIKAETLSKENLLEFLEKHCSDALNAARENHIIYRGVKSSQWDIRVIDLQASERKSQNTTNYYTRILDTNPNNSAWPKRSKSLICSTNSAYAAAYGSVQVVMPFDGLRIGMCPYADIWDTSFNVNGTEYTIKEMNSYFKEFGLDAETVDYNSAIDLISKIDHEELEEFDDESETSEFKEKWMDMYQYSLNEDFKLLDTNEMEDLDYNREVWVGGGKVVVIPLADFEQIVLGE